MEVATDRSVAEPLAGRQVALIDLLDRLLNGGAAAPHCTASTRAI
ncbi:hypothetical protein [Streptomyces sioyaensis]